MKTLQLFSYFRNLDFDTYLKALWQQSEGIVPQDAFLDELLDLFAENEYIVIDDFLSSHEVDLILNRFKDLLDGDAFRKAGIGKQTLFQVEEDVRGDLIKWIEPDKVSDSTAIYTDRIEGLLKILNRAFFLGLKDYESHFAMYPKGTFYARHSDNFRANSHRIISSVCYLNKNWQPENGGQLIIYKDGNNIEIEPIAGRLVLFKSHLEHEVLTTTCNRYSITGWMLDQLHSLTFL